MKKSKNSISLTPVLVAALYFGLGWVWPVWLLAGALWIAMGVITLAFWIFKKLGEKPGSLATAVAGGYTNSSFNSFMIGLVLATVSEVTFWRAGFMITFVTYLIFLISMNLMRLYAMLVEE